MDFSFTEEQQAIRAAIEKVCADFGDEYWLKKDREGGFPHDFHAALAEAGWLGVAMPAEMGGAGLGITEAAIMMQAVAESGGGMSGGLEHPHAGVRLAAGRAVRHRGAEAADASAR